MHVRSENRDWVCRVGINGLESIQVLVSYVLSYYHLSKETIRSTFRNGDARVREMTCGTMS